MTALSALLAATDRKTLNADEGRPSPIGPHLAKDVLLGTRLDELASLALTTTGNGASMIGVEDAGGVLQATNLEAALQELAGISAGQVHHTRWSALDDFFGKANTEAEHGWVLNSGIDAQALDPAIDNAQQGGVWQCVTGDADGATANDGSGMVWADMPIQLDSGGGITVVEFRVRIKSAVSTVSLCLGLTDSTALEEPFTNSADTITSNATDAVAVLYDTDATTDEWWLCAVDTDVDDTGNAATGVAPVADTWQIIRLEISADGATVSVYFDNATTPALTLSGAAGVGPDVVLYPFVIACSTTTTSRTVDVDWCHVRGTR